MQLYTAKWYRAATVRLEGDQIIPQAPFEPYDPFSEYVPVKDVTRWRRSLHYQFAAVKADDPSDVLKFCERFGVLGWHWARTSEATAKHVRKQKKEIKKATGKRVGTDAWKAAMIQNARQELEPYRESYSQSMTLERFRAAQAELKWFMTHTQDVQKRASLYGSLVRDSLSSIFAPHTRGVHPILTWDVQADRWSFRWFAGSLEALLWIMLMLDLLGPGRIIFCARCHAPFLGTRMNERFCSSQCLNVFKVTEWRKRQAKGTGTSKQPESAAKGGPRHGTKRR